MRMSNLNGARRAVTVTSSSNTLIPNPQLKEIGESPESAVS